MLPWVEKIAGKRGGEEEIRGKVLTIVAILGLYGKKKSRKERGERRCSREIILPMESIYASMGRKNSRKEGRRRESSGESSYHSGHFRPLW